MTTVRRIVDLKWLPWTYAAVVGVVLGIVLGNHYRIAGRSGGLEFNTGLFLLGILIAFVVLTPVILGFYIASRIADNQVELGERLARLGTDAEGEAAREAGSTLGSHGPA